MDTKAKKNKTQEVFELYLSTDQELLAAFDDLDSLADVFIHHSERDPAGIANTIFSVNIIKKLLLAVKLDQSKDSDYLS